MPYDAASFKAGFALGRMLWRPPYYTAQYIDTGIGWRAKADYLRWTQADIMGTYEPGVMPSYIQIERYDTGQMPVCWGNTYPDWASPFRVQFTNVTSPVCWMLIEQNSTAWGDNRYMMCVVAVSKEPFSMWASGWGTQSAGKPPSYYGNYIATLTGITGWTDVYGAAMGLNGSWPQNGSYWYTPMTWTPVTSTALHNAVLEHPQIKTIKKTNKGMSVNAFVKFPVNGTYKYVGVGISTSAPYAEVDVDLETVSHTTRTLSGAKFTMYYTDQIDESKNLTPYVPVITLTSMPSISNLSAYQTALFDAVVSAAGITVTGAIWPYAMTLYTGPIDLNTYDSNVSRLTVTYNEQYPDAKVYLVAGVADGGRLFFTLISNSPFSAAVTGYMGKTAASKPTSYYPDAVTMAYDDLGIDLSAWNVYGLCWGWGARWNPEIFVQYAAGSTASNEDFTQAYQYVLSEGGDGS